jgi:antitoxin Phd
MYVDTDKIVTMTAANQNFSAVARQTDRDGKSIIFRNNRPKYILIDLDGDGYLDLTEDERIDVVARRVMKRHKAAFLELAK